MRAILCSKNAVAIAVVGCMLSTFCSPASAAASESPNMILIMADDMGWGDPGYNGNKIIKTPHLDQMSREGIRFNRFYAASSVCSPTRGACLTGRHPYRYGVYSANVGHLKADEISLAEILRDRGYATGHFGKWHLGTLSKEYSGKGPRRRPAENYSTPGMNGFTEWFSTEFAVATWDPYDPANSHLKRGIRFDTRALYWHNDRNVEEALTGDDSRIIMDKTLPFIENAVAQDKPFFAVVWFHAPHAPVVGGPEYRAMYAEHDEDAQHYYACITALDEQVGRLRARLKELGADQNTMIWFCSDNGPEGNPAPTRRHRGSAGPYRGRKRSLYEGGIRVPGLLVWPEKVKEPRAIDIPCVTSDYLPTVLDVVGISMPTDRPYDGISLLPIIGGTVTERPDPIGFQFGPQAAMSASRYKLVHNTGDKRHRSDNGNVPFAEWELYDLQEDPGETTNVIDQYPEIARRLRSQLEEWQASCRTSDAGGDYRSASAKTE